MCNVKIALLSSPSSLPRSILFYDTAPVPDQIAPKPSSSSKTDTGDEMNPMAHGNRVISINNNCGNVMESNNNVWNNCNISISDEKRQVLEWLSPLASRERHQAVRDSRADGVGDWLLHTREFSTWRTLEAGPARPVLLCYGDPGVGKTYMRYELLYPQGNAMLIKQHSSLAVFPIGQSVRLWVRPD